MQTVRVSDEAYAEIARHAGDTGLSLSKALDELVIGSNKASDRLTEQFICLRDTLLFNVLGEGERFCPSCGESDMKYGEPDSGRQIFHCEKCHYTIDLNKL